MTGVDINGILAGNVLHIVATVTRPSGSIASVSPSTAKVAVTDQAGVSTNVPGVQVDYLSDAALTVTADWVIPDTHPDQVITITVDTSGALVAAGERRGVKIEARRVLVMP